MEREAIGWDWANGPPGHTWTVVRGDDVVIGVGGVVELENRSWEAWCWLAETRPRDWRRLLQLAWIALEFAEDWTDGHDLVASARADNPAAIRCLSKLDFHPAYPFEHGRLPGIQFMHMERG